MTGGEIKKSYTKANSPVKFMSLPTWRFGSEPKCWILVCPLGDRLFRQHVLFPAGIARGTPATLDAEGRPVCNASSSHPHPALAELQPKTRQNRLLLGT